MSSRRLFPLLVACCGFVLASSAPLCPCPDDKWQPPFRASQVLYSEFPEDRGRSLDIDRKDISRKGYPLPAPAPPPRPPFSHAPLPSNRLPDDPLSSNRLPGDYSDEYPEGGGGGGGEKDYPDKDYALSYSSGPELPPKDYPDKDYPLSYSSGPELPPKDYPDKDYPLSYSSGPELPPKDYPDYGNSASREEAPASPEYSSESSRETYKQYNSYDDYREDKSKEAGESERDFTLEDFELDPEVVEPYQVRGNASYPPLRPSQSDPGPRHQSDVRHHQSDVRHHQSDLPPHDEVHEPTEPPNTQLELPATQPSSSRLPGPAPVQATGYPLTRTPVPVFRNPALSLMTPNQAGWGHWKNVLEQVELSNLQVMKPPPLGQAQTWGRILNNFAAGSVKSQQFAKRPPLRYGS